MIKPAEFILFHCRKWLSVPQVPLEMPRESLWKVVIYGVFWVLKPSVDRKLPLPFPRSVGLTTWQWPLFPTIKPVVFVLWPCRKCLSVPEVPQEGPRALLWKVDIYGHFGVLKPSVNRRLPGARSFPTFCWFDDLVVTTISNDQAGWIHPFPLP